MMELEALEAKKSGRIRVIVQDNGPIHRCQEVQKLWSKWESQGLYIFFLPKYCSEMNPIELEWQHLKKDELSGQVFDDELYQFRLHRNDKKTAESAESADERRGRGNLYHSDINGNDITTK